MSVIIEKNKVEKKASRPKLLVVDGLNEELSGLVDVVRDWGYLANVASCGRHVLQALQAECIQLVLCAWEAENVTGIELTQQIRQLKFDHYVYIIQISPEQSEDYLLQALHAGADDVLTLPIDGNELEARLHSAERRIELQFRLAQQTQELKHAYELIAGDLRAVSQVQRGYLPDSESPHSDMDYAWASVPSQYVSGDHLQVFNVTKGVYGFYILDVSGHGIPAAVKSMQLVQMFADQAPGSVVFTQNKDERGERIPARPRDVVARLNSIFQQTETDLSYFTLIYGLFEPQKNTITFCQAGHPCALLLRPEGPAEVLGQGGYPVGLFDFDEFEEEEVKLFPGNVFLLYSDGVTEVLNANEEQFGEERLLSTLAQAGSLGWHQIPDRILGAILDWGGKEVQSRGFQDDISILMLGHRQPSAQGPVALTEPPESSAEVELNERGFVSRSTISQLQRLDAAGDSQKSLLIVDDSRSFLRIFEAMLSSWGYKVYAAQSGYQAVSLLEEIAPDFILTDWDMPGMSGIDLCEHIRKSTRDSYVYIIMITGFASRTDLLRSLRVGADDFLTKPVNPSELKVRLQTAERIAELQGDLGRKNAEIAKLYDELQRDMREVARVQRSTLPKDIPSPWPAAVQSVFRPRGYVSGKHFGTLTARPSELGFFMLSLPESDTSSALKAMALARWFSVDRATQLLFPVEEASAKMHRYLADPEIVWKHLQAITPTLTDRTVDFDLLYGLLDLEKGSLLVGCVGQWELVVTHPTCSTRLMNTFKPESRPRKLPNGRYASVLYQDVVQPGSRVFVMPQACADELNLAESIDWDEQILADSGPRDGLKNAMSWLSARIGRVMPKDEGAQDAVASLEGTDFTLVALQWREHFEIEYDQQVEFEQTRLAEHVKHLIAGNVHGLAMNKVKPMALAKTVQMKRARAVIDPTSIAQFGQDAQQFAQALGFDEALGYNIDLVLAEALSNIMLHSFPRTEPGYTEFTLLGFDNALAIVLRESGLSIPPEAILNLRPDMSYLDGLSVDELPEGGMGLTFINMVSDCLFYYHQDGVNEMVMVIARPE